jgi:two-component system chemotaxis response regulator CheY
LYTIGEISKIVNISANTLRYYDEIELLKPSFIENGNQYRYYSDEQIKDITFIMELKQYGFTLYEIKELMKNRNNQKLKEMLEKKRIKLHNEIGRLMDSSILLEKRIFEIIREDELKINGKKVLIVDDLALVRIIIKNIIEGYGYTVVGEVANGEEAIIAYEELKPDLIIMDIVMPKMDGIDAVKRITEKHKNARIIMCSAMNTASIILESINVGARDFVSKPLSSHGLMNAVIRSFNDNYNVDFKRIEHVSKIVENTDFNISLKQEEIDTFIYKIIKEDGQDEFIYNFLKVAKDDSINREEHPVNRASERIEEKVLMYLKDKFTWISEELSTYMSSHLKEDCTIELLTVEDITMVEFKTLISNANSTGVIKYESPYSSAYVHIHGEFENQGELTKEFLNSIANNLNLFLPKYITTQMMLSSVNLKSSTEDYEIVLVSFSIEFVKGGKGFAVISIPHDILHSLFI